MIDHVAFNIVIFTVKNFHLECSICNANNIYVNNTNFHLQLSIYSEKTLSLIEIFLTLIVI